MDATITIQKMMDYFNVSSIQDLAQKMNVSQPTISKWKNRNAISAVKKRCRELGIYNEIFGDLKLSSNKNQKEVQNNSNDLSNYFIALQSVAIATNKEDELIEDIKNLMKKYIGE